MAKMVWAAALVLLCGQVGALPLPFGENSSRRLQQVSAAVCAADINQDGVVSTDDLLSLLAAFGRTTPQEQCGGADQCDAAVQAAVDAANVECTAQIEQESQAAVDAANDACDCCDTALAESIAAANAECVGATASLQSALEAEHTANVLLLQANCDQTLTDSIEAAGAECVQATAALQAALQAEHAAAMEARLGHCEITPLGVSEFTLAGSAVIDGDVLSVTQVAGSQSGTAFASVPVSATDSVSIMFDMYCGDGSGADGMCVNLGKNNLDGRVGEDGLAEGVSLCFDEWSNGGDHGVMMFYNGATFWEDITTSDNRSNDPPVSYFEDATWHSVVWDIVPSGSGASVSFDFDSGAYGVENQMISVYALPADTYIGFSGRTGGATNNHWARRVFYSAEAVPPPPPPEGMTGLATADFTLAGSAVIDGDVLSVTQVAGSQSGTAFASVPVSATDSVSIMFDMYCGDGSGADGMCANLGKNSMDGRAGEDGLAEGVSLCFDEWSNGGDHGVMMFYNGATFWEDITTSDNRSNDPPVSYFEDATWHSVVWDIVPSGSGASVSFDFDSGAYGVENQVVASYALPADTYIGFSGRTGGATNNHWARRVFYSAEAVPPPPPPEGVVTIAAADFTLAGSAVIDGDVLSVTQVAGSQSGTAFASVPVSATDSVSIMFDMYCGDGSGADGMCANLGKNSMDGRAGEDGLAEGVSLCFDEWSNGGDHGVMMFYNGATFWEDITTSDNRSNDPPVSYFEDATWHSVVWDIVPSGSGASVSFDFDSGAYGVENQVVASYALPADTYIGFSGRTGGATNNHWARNVAYSMEPAPPPPPPPEGVVTIAAADFTLAGSAVIDGDVLSVTQVAGSQSGTAFASVPVSATDSVSIMFDMYCGDGSGADGMCANLGKNSMDGRAGEDGLAEGVSLCFDEWSNGGDHGVMMFYNGATFWEDITTSDNRSNDPPVSYFEDATWHSVVWDIVPSGSGASVSFDFDSGAYGVENQVVASYALPADTYIGFSGRTGGATNNHWARNVAYSMEPAPPPPPPPEGMTGLATADFTLAGSAVIDGDVLSVTQVAGSQSGTAFASVPVSATDSVSIMFDMYCGDGSGADGMCANLGKNNLDGRVGEDGLAEGVSLCFDEWSNGGDHGVMMFYNGATFWEDITTSDNRSNDPPVSYFEDATWHSVVWDIVPSGSGASVSFDFDSGAYGVENQMISVYALPADTYIGFSGRTGGATNNHWARRVFYSAEAVPPPPPPEGMTGLATADFTLAGSAVIDGDVLSVTQVAGSQSGTAFASVPVSATDSVSIMFDMYCGDGSGADGMCANLGKNNLDGRVGEDGLAEGVSLCFDEWSNGGDHGVMMFYNGATFWEDITTSDNRSNDPPVSYFEDATWHSVVWDIVPSGSGASVSFDFDSGAYGVENQVIASYALPADTYIGFSGRTGGATNNHWARRVFYSAAPPPPPPAGLVVNFAAADFTLAGSAVIDGDVLSVTQVAGSQSGTAFASVPVSATDSVSIMFDMYCGDGSGADGMCANLGKNNLDGRVGEDGLAEGVSLCFDEWSNGGDHGVMMFYNGATFWEDITTSDNRSNDPPVSYFEDATWHSVVWDIVPSGSGASVSFDFDSGAYGVENQMISVYALPADTYIGFSGRTGGATNNHWARNVAYSMEPAPPPPPPPAGVVTIAAADFTLAGSAVIDGDVLSVTQVAGSQSGTAFASVPVSATDSVSIMFDMYCGDGSGADGMCANLGKNSMDGRAGEDGLAEGVSLCFDEWSNGGDHGVMMFYNGATFWEDITTSDNRSNDPPVSYFEDATWHSVVWDIVPSGSGASVSFDFDSGAYGVENQVVASYALPADTYIGFSGRTGGATNNHWARNVAYVIE